MKSPITLFLGFLFLILIGNAEAVRLYTNADLEYYSSPSSAPVTIAEYHVSTVSTVEPSVTETQDQCKYAYNSKYSCTDCHKPREKIEVHIHEHDSSPKVIYVTPLYYDPPRTVTYVVPAPGYTVYPPSGFSFGITFRAGYPGYYSSGHISYGYGYLGSHYNRYYDTGHGHNHHGHHHSHKHRYHNQSTPKPLRIKRGSF